MTTTVQQELIEALAARNITASFNGEFLNGSAIIKMLNGKQKRQSFSLRFDDAETLEGAAVVDSSLRGTYAESFARDSFFEAIRLGGGEDEALQFANECRKTGVRIGASQEWIESHRDQLLAVQD